MPGTRGARGAAFLPREPPELCPASPPQPRSPGAGLRHPCAPPFPLLEHIVGHFWGVSSRGAGRVCPACGPGDGGRLLLIWGIYTCSLHQQGEIKVYLDSGGFGHRRASGGDTGWGGTRGTGARRWQRQERSGGDRAAEGFGVFSGWQLCPPLDHSQLGTGGSAGVSPGLAAGAGSPLHGTQPHVPSPA